MAATKPRLLSRLPATRHPSTAGLFGRPDAGEGPPPAGGRRPGSGSETRAAISLSPGPVPGRGQAKGCRRLSPPAGGRRLSPADRLRCRSESGEPRATGRSPITASGSTPHRNQSHAPNPERLRLAAGLCAGPGALLRLVVAGRRGQGRRGAVGAGAQGRRGASKPWQTDWGSLDVLAPRCESELTACGCPSREEREKEREGKRERERERERETETEREGGRVGGRERESLSPRSDQTEI